MKIFLNRHITETWKVDQILNSKINYQLNKITKSIRLIYYIVKYKINHSYVYFLGESGAKMADNKKTKQQLIEEITQLNTRIEKTEKRYTSEQKKIKIALNKSTKRLEGFEKHSTEGLYRVDIPKPVPIDLPREKIIEWIDKYSIVGLVNDHLAHMYGLEPADMIGRPSIDFAPNYGERVVLLLENENNQVTNEATEDVDKDGNVLCLLESYHGIIKDGFLTEIWGAQRDVTERRMAVNAMRESDEKFIMFAENAPGFVCIYDCDKDGNRENVYLSPGIDKLLDKTTAKIVNNDINNYMQLIHQEDQEGFQIAADQSEATNKLLDFEYRVKIGPDTYRWARSIAKCVHKSDEKTRWHCQIFDVTERRKFEEVLAEEQNRAKNIIEGTNAGTWDWNVQTGEVILNERWAEIIGRSLSELGPTTIKTWAKYLHSEDRSNARSQLDLHFSGENDYYDVQFRQPHKDGHWVWVNARGKVVEWSNDGKPLRMSGTHIDITKSKELEKRISKIEKMESLGILAGGIAHDFNNLLQGVIGGAELALMYLEPPSPVYENIQTIISSANKATDLSKQMLAYSGKGKFNIQNVDLQKITDAIVDQLNKSLSKNLVLKSKVSNDVPAIRGDISQVSQSIKNLVINASEAIGDNSGDINILVGTKICDNFYLNEIEMEENLIEGEYVFIEVSDTGCGMNRETISKLFDPFFTTKFTGRGLGLSAVQGTMRGHKGAIHVDSQFGKGSTFTLLFPIHKESEKKIEQEIVADNTFVPTGKVLLVDDDEIPRVIGKRMLEKIGFEVLTANNGVEALPIYKENIDQISLVILDLTMPEMNGEETFVELNKINKDVKVIVSSGYDEHEVANRFVGKSVVGFCQKPYKYQTLKKKIIEILM
jgi:PAS domain S-box-containing protein